MHRGGGLRGVGGVVGTGVDAEISELWMSRGFSSIETVCDTVPNVPTVFRFAGVHVAT